MKPYILLAVIVLIMGSCGVNSSDQLTTTEFSDLLSTVAKGWNDGNARMAADCFAVDAIYTEPPDQQLYRGREELFEFFGGENGRSDPMSMTWHNIVFNERDQIGTGEYTFGFKGRRTHGIVIIKIVEGKIWRWREYQYRTQMKWEDFIGESGF